MRKYKWDDLLIGQDGGAIRRAILRAGACVNSVRTRGRAWIGDLLQGWWEYERNANAFPFESQTWSEGRPTATLRTWREGVVVMGCAHWIAPDRTLFVRVVAETVEAPTIGEMRRLLRPWGLTQAQAENAGPLHYVFPALYVSRTWRGIPERAREWCQMIRQNVLSRDIWGVLHDWCLDGNWPEYPEGFEDVMGVLRMLAPHMNGWWGGHK